jgi:hypothetical protein
MTSQQQQLRKLLSRDRWSALRYWCFAVGVVTLVVAVEALGYGGSGNPKTASSIYSAFAAAGMLQWLAMPLACIGLVTVAAGAAITALLWKRRNSD